LSGFAFHLGGIEIAEAVDFGRAEKTEIHAS